MIVVLCHVGDLSAQWAAERLRARSGRPVEVVFVESFAAPATVWHHEVRDSGTRVDVALADGRRLRSGEIDAVLNRMLQPPEALIRAAAEGDESYSRNELTSFAASWLRALAPRVVNPPTPQGLCGRWRPAPGWRMLALDAGLPIGELAFDSTDPPPPLGAADGPGTTVLTIGGRMMSGAAPADVCDAAAQLAALAETPVLGLRFAGTDPPASGWRLLDATPYPDLSTAGEAGVEALEAELAA